MANAPAKDRSRLLLAAATAGSIVESFDWLIYAVLAPYFAHAIFPGDDPVVSLLASYLVFAIGFLIRPIGAVIMGRIIDRQGRKFGLVVSVSMISVGALVIALTPSYDTIGVLAALIVVFARLVQGLSMSGEQAAVGTYLLETAPRNRRFLFGAIASASSYVGQMLATACLAILLGIYGVEGLESGGWRVGFLVCAAMGLIALWIRGAAPESEIFTEQVKNERPRQLPLLRARTRQAAAIFLMLVPVTMGMYFITAYLAKFLSHAGVATKEQVTGYVPIFTVYLILVILVSGFLADRFGGLRILRIGYVTLAVCTLPVIIGLSTGVVPILPGALLYLTVLGSVTGPFAMVGPQLFPPAVRAVGVGLPSMLSVALFGGTFPLIAEGLTAAGNSGAIPWYIGVGAVLGLVGNILVRKSDLVHDSDTEDESKKIRQRTAR
ncbi:MFS transporter [Rhodococcus jostii]|uniref:MFS transporter n=1 Tax=Rhodococcus jostii TaxID=132919 RepID=UPI0036310632